MKDIRKHPKVYVEWFDAFSDMGWKSPSEIDSHLVCITIGFLVKEDKDGITISCTINNNGEFTDPLTIPRGMIRRRKSIKI